MNRSTYLSLHYHVVFSTRNREALIPVEHRSRLHAYMGGTLAKMGANPESIGGVADHVHALIGLRATDTIAVVVRELKKAATSWMQGVAGVRGFAWQEGYAAFTVSAGMRERVSSYIARQEEHHRVRTFAEEYADFIARCGNGVEAIDRGRSG